MGARTILYTGKGGVGKTSVAAATARRLAGAGLRTLIISTDPAHSLCESLDAPLGDQPSPAAPRLWGQQVDAQREIERHWSAVQAWLAKLLVDHGVERISAEELTVPPGMDELFSLLALETACAGEEWEAVVVDCAPTGETLRLLSFPDMARWWIERVAPAEHQILTTAGPLARALLDLELPGHGAFADMRRLSARLIALHELLCDHARCTVRLVVNPEPMVIAEAMRTFTYLNLYGFLTDAIVVNRIFPPEVGDYFAAWRAVQEEHLELVRSAFAPVPVLCAPYFEREVAGAAMLERLAAAVFDAGGHDPAAVLHESLTQSFVLGDGAAQVRLALPFARKEDISLKKVGLELVVRAGAQKRTIALPSALASYHPRGATFRDGALEVSFDGAR